MMRFVLNLSYIATQTLLAFTGLTYHSLSPGLALSVSGGAFFCRELLSAGSDDDAMILVFSLFSLPLLLRVFWSRRKVTPFEIIVLLCCVAAAVVSLWVASLDCADVVFTAFVLPDRLLASALMALPVSVAMLIALYVANGFPPQS